MSFNVNSITQNASTQAAPYFPNPNEAPKRKETEEIPFPTQDPPEPEGFYDYPIPTEVPEDFNHECDPNPPSSEEIEEIQEQHQKDQQAYIDKYKDKFLNGNEEISIYSFLDNAIEYGIVTKDEAKYFKQVNPEFADGLLSQDDVSSLLGELYDLDTQGIIHGTDDAPIKYGPDPDRY